MAHISIQERSHQFVEAAARVIAQEGLTAATTRRIAAEAGAPLAALHYCFRSKDELLDEVYNFLSRDYARELDPMPQGLSLEEAVSKHAHRIWRRMLNTPHEQVTTFELLLRQSRLNDNVESQKSIQLNRSMYQSWIDSTEAIFRAGAMVSGIENPIGLEVMARAFIANIDGISLQHLSDPNEERSWELVEILIDSTTHQILKRNAVGEQP
ncbi:TetR family transcriptional regulator [Arthrobacter sp. MYb227]|uniref:TetR/AcrR family transcriptional regulator n=1 Tax=Arthrobacter sp. MYb227 TaxID=1848601 RepID=UPI000CFB7FBD|nr:TetR family transcriptional regulator [Arthrobacter sp. MYb227]PQZ85756.1 TetR family transcriptional regulator [Arthrobacter sp. MYb227]